MNTLEIVNILEKNYDRDEAIKLAEAINGKSGLATKEDIANVKADLKEDIAEVKTELKNDIAEVKIKLEKNIAEVKTDIAEVKTELKTSYKWIKGILIASFGTMTSGIIAILIATYEQLTY